MTHDELAAAAQMLADYQTLGWSIEKWERLISEYGADADFSMLAGLRPDRNSHITVDVREFRAFADRNLAALRERHAELAARIAAL